MKKLVSAEKAQMKVDEKFGMDNYPLSKLLKNSNIFKESTFRIKAHCNNLQK